MDDSLYPGAGLLFPCVRVIIQTAGFQTDVTLLEIDMILPHTPFTDGNE